MLLHCAVLLLYLNVARTSEVNTLLSKDFVSDVDSRYSLWPSIHNGVRLMRIRKREAEAPQPSTLKPDAQSAEASAKDVIQGAQSAQSLAQSSGQSLVQANAQSLAQASALSGAQSGAQSGQSGVQSPANPPTQPPQQQQPVSPPASTTTPAAPNNKKDDDKENEKPQILDNKTVHKPQSASANDTSNAVENKTKVHNTTATEPPKINLSDPGVMKRAFIVFGGFALLATAYYFIIYRKKGNTSDAKNTHSSIDPNQFRYGVLQSEDKRSNMELSRVPLTMESDEDDDEDLEIFDLGQKKKSLSYINLEQHDEDIVLNDSRSIDMENLLVDIEDKNSDTLINWSSSGSKSIL